MIIMKLYGPDADLTNNEEKKSNTDSTVSSTDVDPSTSSVVKEILKDPNVTANTDTDTPPDYFSEDDLSSLESVEKKTTTSDEDDTLLSEDEKGDQIDQSDENDEDQDDEDSDEDERPSNTHLIDGTVVSTSVSLEKVLESYSRLFANTTKKERAKIVSTPGSDGQVVATIIPQYDAIEEGQEMLTKQGIKPDNKKFRHNYVDDKYKLGTFKPKPKASTKKDKRIYGSDALTISYGSTTRHLLYGTGISVTLRQETLAEINSYVSKCTNISGLYGNILGSRIEGIQDLVYKREFAEFLKGLIIDSSLEPVGMNGNILDYILYTDLAPLAMHVASNMHDGHHPNFHILRSCGDVEQIDVSLSKLINVDFTQFSEKEMTYLQQQVMSTHKEKLKNQREYIKRYDDVEDHRVGKVAFKFSVPVVSKFMKFGADTITKIYKEMTDNDISIVKEVDSYIRTRLMSFYLPWIESITVYESETSDEIVGILTESTAMSNILLGYITNNKTYREEFNEHVSDYILKVQVTHLCYPEQPTCSICGKEIESKTGFTTINPYASFFTLCVQKLQ